MTPLHSMQQCNHNLCQCHINKRFLNQIRFKETNMLTCSAAIVRLFDMSDLNGGLSVKIK